MATICILGAGELGGAVAHALARHDRVSRIVLIDDAGDIAAGKALDIQQAGAVEAFHVRLAGTDDLTATIGCAACIVADAARRPGAEWQGDAGLTRISRVAPFLAKAPLVFAGAAQGPLLLAAVREAGVARPRALGSAPEAFAAAIAAVVAMEARCSSTEVKLSLVGAPPGGGFVVAWSEASVGGYAVERALTPVQLARVDARVASLWPPGPFALGLAAARVTEAIVAGDRRAWNVLAVLGGEFGVHGRLGTVPAVLASTGIVHTRAPSLSTRERVRLENALTRP